MNDVERIWTTARNLRGEFKDRKTPSAGITGVLVALLATRQAHVTRIAELSEQDQGNVTRWLAKLGAWGFVRLAHEEPGFGHQGGGRPALFWSLTPDGHQLAKALIA
jgi:hypothetical protein